MKKYFKRRSLALTGKITLALLATSAVGAGCSSSDAAEAGSASAHAFSTDAMVYNGDGAWSTEVTSLESILKSNGATYREVTSDDLNGMSAQDMSQYGAFVWPGGEGGTMSDSLTTATKANIREAVQSLGVNYIGFCAGSFVAVAPTPAPGKDPDYGIGVVNGPDLQYYQLEAQFEASGQTDIAMTEESFADGTKRDLVWYGGPVVPSGPNMVIAKYPTGDAAISQMKSGNGWVVLSGVHPAAPQSLIDEFGLNDPDGTSFDIAWKLLNDAIHVQPLPTFPS